MSKLSILSEFWEFLRVRKKVLVSAYRIFPTAIWYFDCFNRGDCNSTIYICTVLTEINNLIYFLHLFKL